MNSRTGGQILIDQLVAQGVDHVFCVPGESYLPALDALHDASSIALTVCRQEGGAAMMAEAYGKLTGRPGICFVTRGPGATNASPGVHIARQDSTPMILLVGQIGRGVVEREAFQELDYRAVFGTLAKWATQIDAAERIPEIIARAFHVALSGRPGPVVIALPEETLTEAATCVDAPRVEIGESVPSAADLARLEDLIAAAERPVLIAGGSRWTPAASRQMCEFAASRGIPVCVSFRRQSLCPAAHPNYIGDMGIGANPALVRAVKNADLVLLVGTRLSEATSQGYTLLDIPVPAQKVVHVHPGSDELGRVYQPTLGLNVSPSGFFNAISLAPAPPARPRGDHVAGLRQAYLAWSEAPTEVPARFNLGKALVSLRDKLPQDAVITNGAGNYASWINRFGRFGGASQLLAPTSGSMGYGIPAAVGVLRLNPRRRVIAFAGDGCFLMNGQEFATAVQYDLPLIVIIVDNASYGTIRMHQEQQYPGRVVGTNLRNPDFAQYAVAFGGHGERVERTEDFLAAFERATASGKPSIIHCLVDVEAISPAKSLTDFRTRR
jgi:acetolactate synthase-1/2/3 large subunit